MVFKGFIWGFYIVLLEGYYLELVDMIMFLIFLIEIVKRDVLD